MDVLVSGKKLVLSPKDSIGKGGEADVFDIGNGKALKLFKPPNHPDFNGLPQEAQAAAARIKEHQRKLRQFPVGLPPRVIVPANLVFDKSGKTIVGYTMPYLTGTDPLIRLSNRKFRENGFSNQAVVTVFKDMHTTMEALHKSGVVIGDFNDLNVLVTSNEAYFIDTDSFQFGPYLTTVFTAKFVDPLRCLPNTAPLTMKVPHNANSDWYAFNVMLMGSLLYVDPYGGVHVPIKGKQLNAEERILQRMTVFHSEIRYPKPAVPFTVLPDDLLDHFHNVFEKDRRGTFPRVLLDNMHWTTCSNCGSVHARAICPNCTHVAQAAVKSVTTVQGTVTSTRIFATRGVILYATLQNGKLNWLYYEDDKYKREDGQTVWQDKLDPQIRYRIFGNQTLFGKGNKVYVLQSSQIVDQYQVESVSNLPIFDANQSHIYWITNGQLMKNDQFGPSYIGNVLRNQTLFWVGPTFGFGFYRASNLQVSFVFDAENRGIFDSVNVPLIQGQIIDSTCSFTASRCWFFVTTRQRGKTYHSVYVINRNGQIEASYQEEHKDDSWLATIRGKCSAGNFLLAATDQGIVRMEIFNGQIMRTKEFPDTTRFVDSHSALFPSADGLYVVDQKEIKLIKIS